MTPEDSFTVLFYEQAQRIVEAAQELRKMIVEDVDIDRRVTAIPAIEIAADALGTLLGGWRIVHTMGSRITHLKPIQGFCAETGGAITLFLATALGVPVSTTHTITGAIVGVGAARRAAAVRWGVAQRIVLAWAITMPAAALIGGLTYRLLRLL